jgi:hypothetical protein
MWAYVLEGDLDVEKVVKIIRGLQGDAETMNAITKLDDNSRKFGILFKIH